LVDIPHYLVAKSGFVTLLTFEHKVSEAGKAGMYLHMPVWWMVTG